MQKVYIVEDSPLVCERLLELLGPVPGACIVGHASTVEDAIAGILAERPDSVLLDLRLGKGNGYEVLRAIHAQAPEIDVYMLSNFAAEPYRQFATQLGARGFFDKTTEIGRVRRLVAERAAATI